MLFLGRGGLGRRMAEVERPTSEHGQLKAALLLMAQEAIGSWEPELMSAWVPWP